MFSGRVTQAAVRLLDFVAVHALPAKSIAQHLRTGQRGEEDAYFYLRRHNYIIVARNFRSPRRRGEIDLIAWHKGILCFIEVKTRTTHDVKPAETAVDRRKWRELHNVANEYLRVLPSNQQTPPPEWLFDVVTVYCDRQSRQPQFELFQNALPSS